MESKLLKMTQDSSLHYIQVCLINILLLHLLANEFIVGFGKQAVPLVKAENSMCSF